ncbi:MAG: Catechol 2,3-dioxygenase [Solirubrobacterales bacterium]|nr:Catechol 2,3-dioxygenase [Solirubrobacterales bacterium]
MAEHVDPIFDIAQLAHVEMLSTDPAGTERFFTEFLGMSVTAREGNSVYLRAYEEAYHSSLKITEAAQPGLGHVAWRTQSPAALERRVAAIETAGLGQRWIDGDLGHGEAYQFTTPDGHAMELFWDVERWEATPELRTPLLNRPQRRPTQGVPVRRIDHVNLMASDAAENRRFFEEHLGFRTRERIVAGEGAEQIELGNWMSVSPLVHEIAIMRDPSGTRGRFHHVCYWYGVPQHCNDAAEVLREAGYEIEAGPGKHGVSQATFLYVWEPGGNRVELFGDVGYLIQEPDWQPVTWHAETDMEWLTSIYGPIPMSFFEIGMPPVGAVEPVGA